MRYRQRLHPRRRAARRGRACGRRHDVSLARFRFDLCSGGVLRGPAREPEQWFEALVWDGTVEVRLPKQAIPRENPTCERRGCLTNRYQRPEYVDTFWNVLRAVQRLSDAAGRGIFEGVRRALERGTRSPGSG